jgi:hypothetical protein
LSRQPPLKAQQHQQNLAQRNYHQDLELLVLMHCHQDLELLVLLE